VAGTFFGMAAVGAASLDLSSGTLAQARLSWALMFALVAGTIIVFAERARYAGVGLLSLGKRSLVLVLVAVALVVGAQLTAAAAPARPVVVPALPPATASAPAPEVTAPAPEASAPVPAATGSAEPTLSASAAAVAVDSAAPVASAAPSAVVAPPVGEPGTVQVETVTTRGMLEADARGGVARRTDRLTACLVDPKNNQKGSLSLKIGIDPSGSVSYSKATDGDLKGTPLGNCLLAVFYKMGFAAPASNSAGFEITLRVP